MKRRPGSRSNRPKRQRDRKSQVGDVVGFESHGDGDSRPLRIIIYAGDSEGRLQVSSDGGKSWGTPFRLTRDSGPVQAIWVDRNDPRVAVAALGARTSIVLKIKRGPPTCFAP